MTKILSPSIDDLTKELTFRTSRSGGPGGQNVNKVNTKVILKFDVSGSAVLTEEQKLLLLNKLQSSLTKDGCIVLSAQEERSQLANKEAALNKFSRLITKAFTYKKIRKAAKPSKAAKEKRIKNKKQHSEKKQLRQKPF